MEAVKEKKRDNKPKLRHSKGGVLYAHPKDILESANAQKQLKAIRESNLYKRIRKKKQKS